MEKIKGREARRVRRAAKLLDKCQRTWYRRVDPKTLNLASFADCVLGQAYGDIDDVPTSLLLRVLLGGHWTAFGLGLYGKWDTETSRQLHTAWRYEIAQRRRTGWLRDRLAATNAQNVAEASTKVLVTLPH